MPLYYKSHMFPILRKSEKSKSTNIVFDINKKNIQVLNYQNIQSFFTIELINYPIDNKIDIIRLIKKISNMKVKDIQLILNNIPHKILTEVPKKDIKKIEMQFILLGADIRIL